MKRNFCLFIVLLCCASKIFAYDALIDGIYYYLDTTNMTAKVTNESGSIYDHSYSGSVTIPSSITYNQQNYSVTTIGRLAFYECKNLTSITIPNSVTTIEESAFWCCKGLSSITIPNSVTTIEHDAFNYCSGLTKTNYTGTIGDWFKINFGDDFANPMSCSHNFFINDVEVKDLVIPQGVETIKSYAFSYCSGLTSVTIPNSVTKIRIEAFFECRNLTTVTIDSDTLCSGKQYKILKKFGSQVKKLVVGNSVTKIGTNVFKDCSGLTSITIGKSVTTIGDYAFSGCSGLEEIYCYAKNPPAIEHENTFQNVSCYCPIHVPAGKIPSYRSATVWKIFYHFFEIDTSWIEKVTNSQESKGCKKILLNGQVVIEKDGKTYNVLGGEVR